MKQDSKVISLAGTTVTYGGDFRSKIKAMSAAGFRETEVWMSDLFEHPEGPDVAIKVMADHGVMPIALQALRNFEGCPQEQMPLKHRFAVTYLDVCAALQIPVLVLASHTGADALGGTQRLIDDLGVLGDLARERGIKIAYEPVAWARHTSTLASAIPLLSSLRHPAIGLQLDSFHVSMEQGGIAQLSKLGQDVPVFLVEVSDHAATQGLSSIDISRAYRLLPGEGNSDVGQFGEGVRALGYCGPIVIEIFNAYYKTLDPLAMAGRAFSAIAAYRDNFLA